MAKEKNTRVTGQNHGNNSHKGGNANSQKTPGLARGKEEARQVNVPGNESESSNGGSGNSRQGGTGGAIRSGR